nr:MAG TPA: hypothetical protein [Caudoviricetes sp.]
MVTIYELEMFAKQNMLKSAANGDDFSGSRAKAEGKAGFIL